MERGINSSVKHLNAIAFKNKKEAESLIKLYAECKRAVLSKSIDNSSIKAYEDYLLQKRQTYMPPGMHLKQYKKELLQKEILKQKINGGKGRKI